VRHDPIQETEMNSLNRLGTWLASVVALAGCSASGDLAPTADAGQTGDEQSTMMDAPVADDSSPAAPYPAPHPAIPTEVSGGTVMTAPKVVSVTFQNDPLETDIDTFVSSIAKTTYWGDRTMEYGVAPIVPAVRVHDTTTNWGASATDAQIQKWLAAQIGQSSGLPAADENTLYSLYFPPGVTVVGPGIGPSCGTNWHGYHYSTLIGGQQVAYAIISRCPSIPEDPRATGINYVSAVASHELIEAVTDPFPGATSDTFGYAEPDPDHIAFMFAGMGELGDMCVPIGGAFYIPSDFPYLVQRTWSNKVAPTGHDPCLPEPPGQVYFNSAPVLNDDVTIKDNGQAGATKGVHIPVGQSKTIEIDLFSEAPSSAWTVSAKEVGGTGLAFAFDNTSGANGDKLHLTITVNHANPSFGAEVFLLTSTLGTQHSVWAGTVGN